MIKILILAMIMITFLTLNYAVDAIDDSDDYELANDKLDDDSNVNDNDFTALVEGDILVVGDDNDDDEYDDNFSEDAMAANVDNDNDYVDF